VLTTGKREGLGDFDETTETGREGGAVGTPCWEAMASWRRQRTSSALARSIGVWPS
jgi:hypothetical protein